MVETINTDRPQFIATKKDALGTGFGSMERSVEQLDYGKRYVRATLEYDFDVDGAVAASGGTKSFRAEGESSAFVLPANAQIIQTFAKVGTTFESSTDAAALSVGIPTDDDEGIIAEAAISAGGNVWDSTTKVIAGIQVGTAGSASELTTAERNIVLKNDHASEATTAGAMKLYIEYLVV